MAAPPTNLDIFPVAVNPLTSLLDRKIRRQNADAAVDFINHENQSETFQVLSSTPHCLLVT